MNKSKYNYTYIGKQYGYLTILGFSHVDKSGLTHVICECICGKIIKPRLVLLEGSIQQKSCGCRNPIYKKHGYSTTKLYRIWKGLTHRCESPNNESYKNYGGKGIIACKEWSEDFLTFRFQMRKKYLNAKRKYKGEVISIERLNNNKGYYYDNCTFIPRRFQNRNKRNVYPCKATNRKTGKEVYGKNQAELARKINLSKSTIRTAIISKSKLKEWIIRPLLKNPQ